MKDKQLSTPGLRTAMILARRRLYLPVSELAKALRISDTQMYSYENGSADIPVDMMAMIISLGYLMLRARNIQHEYGRVMNFIRRENMWNDLPK